MVLVEGIIEVLAGKGVARAYAENWRSHARDSDQYEER